MCGGGGGDPHRSMQRTANSVGTRGFQYTKISGSFSHPLLTKARQLEASGEYLKAVEHYLKVTPDLIAESEGRGSGCNMGEGECSATMSNTAETCENIWVHAANLAGKFLTSENSTQVTELVASRLARLQVTFLRPFYCTFLQFGLMFA